MYSHTMSAMHPGIRRTASVADLLRQGTRFAAVALYASAVIVALMLVRPAFRDTPAPALEPAAVQAPATDKIRKGESVATFAARHGLDLGDLLALNPRVDSLALRSGTELRIR
jgi:LysM repeat protein